MTFIPPDDRYITRLSLSELASIIEVDWRKAPGGVNYAAKPYLQAMETLLNISDCYGADSGDSIVAYFLANASTWRGPIARVVKKELKRRLSSQTRGGDRE